jgi:biopolymer transport protein ExbB
VVDAGERATFALRANLRVFSAIHTLGPLLGLVGTVFGIIRAFNSLAIGVEGERSNFLANGISQALLATAFGLIVAIPALVFYFWFQSRGDQFVFEMDALAQELVGMVSAEGIQARSQDSRAAKPRRAAAPRPEPTA